MIQKLHELSDGYMSNEEAAKLAELHDKPTPLTEEDIIWLTRLYSRIYSIHR